MLVREEHGTLELHYRQASEIERNAFDVEHGNINVEHGNINRYLVRLYQQAA